MQNNFEHRLLKLPAGWCPTRNPELGGDWRPDWNYIRYCISGTVLFYLAASVFIYSAGYFTDYDTGRFKYVTLIHIYRLSVLSKFVFQSSCRHNLFPCGPVFHTDWSWMFGMGFHKHCHHEENWSFHIWKWNSWRFQKTVGYCTYCFPLLNDLHLKTDSWFIWLLHWANSNKYA